MKRYLVLFLSLFLLSCGAEEKTLSKTQSGSQSWLASLYDQYEKEFNAAGNELVENEVKAKYQSSIDNYFEAKGNVMDSFNVTVWSVEQPLSNVISVKFREGPSTFTCIQNIENNDSLYQYIKTLKEQDRVTVSFSYVSCEVNNPSSKYLGPFQFDVVPLLK